MESQLAEMDAEQRSVPQVSIVHVEGELFGAADLFHDQMRRICEPNLKIVVLKMRNAREQTPRV